jgi:hypothetical protein
MITNISITGQDGTSETRRSYQRMVTALDQFCPFREHERVVAAIRSMRARTYGARSCE